MTKLAFLSELHDELAGLPLEDIQRSLDYYREMIDDHMENGMTEEEAVAAVGPAKEIAARILAEMPIPEPPPAPEPEWAAEPEWTPQPDWTPQPARRKLKTWQLVLLILGSPVWLPLLVAVVIVPPLALYIVLWAVVVTLYAADLALAIGLLGGLAASVAAFADGSLSAVALLLGAGLICGGFAILGFFGCNQVARWAVALTMKPVRAAWRKLFGGRDEG